MADWVTRVWALAIATAACIGLPGALVYATVRIAAARRYGATFALGLVLVFWVTISAAYYPRVCADLIPWPPRLRRRRGPGPGDGELSLPAPLPQQSSSSSFVIIDAFPGHGQAPPATARGGGGGGARVRAGDIVGSASYPYELRRVPSPQRHGLFPWEAPPARGGGARAGGAADDDVPPPPPPPPYPSSCPCEQQRVALARSHGEDRHASTTRGMMAALPRELPAAARGKARAGAENDDDVVVDVPRPTCEGQSDKCCVICLVDVDTEETAKRLPLCLHVFHRQCIDQWLRAHSTCPTCRCNVRLHDSTSCHVCD